jgi:cell division protein FtsA
MAKDELIVGLDIGSTKIAVVVAEPHGTGGLNILGVGKTPSDGLKKGMIVDLEKVVGCIQTAVIEAENATGVKIKSVYTGIAGEHIRSINSRGVIAVGKGNAEINKADVDRVVEAARAVAIPADREIIHVLPQEFTVDDQSGISDPVGMTGTRLEVSVHIVTGSIAAVSNIVKAVEKADLEVEELVLGPFASAYAVLNPDERDLGCVLIDLGGGNTDIAAFLDGSIKHTAVLGVGGKNVTSDIAIGLRTPLEQAERIKCQHACALQTLVGANDTINVPGVAGREPKDVALSVLAAIVEPRAEEMFSLVARELTRVNLIESLASGVILTGGASQLRGLPELAEQIFDLPAKIARPTVFLNGQEQTLGPEFSTGVGLVKYGLLSSRLVSSKSGKKRGFGIISKIKDVFSEYF